jgi:hypothetical protein
MKKYVLIGLFAGTAISLALLYIMRKKQEGLEFHDFVESSEVADDLFGRAFSELPDKP